MNAQANIIEPKPLQVLVKRLWFDEMRTDTSPPPGSLKGKGEWLSLTKQIRKSSVVVVGAEKQMHAEMNHPYTGVLDLGDEVHSAIAAHSDITLRSEHQVGFDVRDKFSRMEDLGNHGCAMY
tara:strand:- start:387 stop:752 length:366 start_codon:yes stop_codon:yes gene_type:complete